MRRLIGPALALALAGLQAALLVDTAYDKSNTVDEEIYIGNAARQWNGQLTCEPPLPQWGFAVALRIADPTGMAGIRVSADPKPARRAMLYDRTQADMRANLVAARFATIAAVVAGGLFLWAAARRFGARAAAVTHALWCLSPLVIAHGALAATDAWGAATMCVVAWAAVRLVERPTALRAGVVGAAAGLAACSKLTTLVALPVLLAIGLWAARSAAAPAPWRRRALAFTGAGIGGFLAVVWWVYGFGVAPIGDDINCPVARHLWSGPSWPLPFPELIEGILVQLDHGYVTGHPGFLFGANSDRGWWWFYLASLALETTLAAQAIFAARVAAAIARRPGRRDLLVDGALLAFPVLALLLLSAGRTQNGIKYLLPLYPCAMLWAGRVTVDLDRLLAGCPRRIVRAAWAALVATVALGAASMLAIHPHHLMYYNAWAGGPEGGPRYLVHGSDWGQDTRRLAIWQREHDIRQIHYTPYASLAKKWGVRYDRIQCRPDDGWFAIHVIHAYRPQPEQRGCLDWLTVEPPDARIGYSILLYHVDAARLNRLREERGRITPFLRTGPPP